MGCIFCAFDLLITIFALSMAGKISMPDWCSITENLHGLAQVKTDTKDLNFITKGCRPPVDNEVEPCE